MLLNNKLTFHIGLLVIFLLFFLAPLDTDLGWHLRYGDYFLQTGNFLNENILTYLLPDYKWANSYTFYQILTSLIYKSGGFFALSFAYSMLGVLTYWVFDKINPQTRKFNLILFLLVVLLGWNVFNIGWRVQVFSFTFLILTFYLLDLVERNWRVLFVLPPLFVLWANLHGAFVLGLAVLGIFTIQLVWERKIKLGTKLLGVTLVSALAALINPYGLGIYQEALRHAQYPLGGLIAEWLPYSTEAVL